LALLGILYFSKYEISGHIFFDYSHFNNHENTNILNRTLHKVPKQLLTAILGENTVEGAVKLKTHPSPPPQPDQAHDGRGLRLICVESWVIAH
jgi:hypothetical protein